MWLNERENMDDVTVVSKVSLWSLTIEVKSGQ